MPALELLLILPRTPLGERLGVELSLREQMGEFNDPESRETLLKRHC